MFPFISHQQFGFLPNWSSLQQLLLSLSRISNSFSSHSQTDVVYLDIRKAFDSIPHDRLLDKLWSLGICGSLWRWLQFYLCNRRQCVSINGSHSSFLPVLSGVPQGSVLGPLLFLLYINDLPNTVSHALPLMFADDTKCLSGIYQASDCDRLQSDLDALSDWSVRNCLSFNTSKCVLVRFSRSPSPYTGVYTINGVPVVRKKCHKDLGIFMSEDLTWSSHYDYLCAKAYRTLGLLKRTFSSSLSVTAKKQLYISLVRSQLSYCSPIWRPHLIKDIKSLERIQRRATKFILGSCSLNYKERLLALKLLPLMYILELNDLFFFISNLKTPSNNFSLLSYISFSTGSTRSAAHGKLIHTHSSTVLVQTTPTIFFDFPGYGIPFLSSSVLPYNQI